MNATGWPAATAVAGVAASLDDAIAAAARLLRGAAAPVIGGVETDDAGARAAACLARALGGAIGLDSGRELLRDLHVMRTAGWIVTTPLQARARADLVLVVGDGVARSWPGMVEDLALNRNPDAAPERARRTIGFGAASPAGLGNFHNFAGGAARLATLRALVAGRRVAADGLDGCVKLLKAAKFGVAVWSANDLDEMTIEMLCGLIDDLNAETRFAGLPIGPGGNAPGVAEALTSHSGFPTAISFRGETPAHDSWRFDPSRMAAAGEADAAVWIGALGAPAPSWIARVPTVALASAGTRFESPPDVCIAVGSPGVDHGAVLHERRVGGLIYRAAGAASEAPSVAGALDRLALEISRSC